MKTQLTPSGKLLPAQGAPQEWLTIGKILFFSGIGIFLFFVPVTINGKNTILLDHATTLLTGPLKPAAIAILLMLMAYGALSPLINGSYKESVSNLIFSAAKVLGLVLALLYLTNTAPAWAMQKDMLPFLFEKLALNVGILIPIGAVALTFLIGFGLLELLGVMMERLMRPLFRTPGASSIDAVASFVGSYSVGMLITNRLYSQGRYSLREAMIIATGFSTVSATFMIIVAKTLGIMEYWNFYFWSALIVTFTVTTITAYIPPLSLYNNDAPNPMPEAPKGEAWAFAKAAGIKQYQSNPSLLSMMKANLLDGIRMSSVVAPSILAIGFIGLILSKYTPVFEWLGLVLKPFMWLTGIDGLSQYSGQFASGLAEMFLPAILLKDADLAVRYIAAVTCISSVLFFSGSIPCMLATRIPMRFWHLLIIWLVRTVLSILLASIALRLGLAMGWLA
ncbi:YjiH family protein [Vitreoscilla massiliensis]|uniref:YjiH family protein n=1 Tax=Vitreoscilla massiliensis TaxID=1689272 RepID=A0ABY4DZX5_9NEIS|nr:YjiH family protein [Vitreoscilla massiliensis]UOO89041.1 YjiH family protein [Vitreoscilla massiliensis]